MMRRPPRSTLDRSSAASDVYKRQRQSRGDGQADTAAAAADDGAAALEVEMHGRSLVPVSYKHLRAHETVLDLVCRLLLENKKLPRYHRHTSRIHPTVTLTTKSYYTWTLTS